ncbi:MAG: hypothetical protein V4584_18205 [Verrucomicrobiota bacterium]
MNSDPRDSAAWRAFGMLDADEASAFDEAMRHDPELKNSYREMECITAAVAATTTRPISPRAGQLEQLHLRLGLNAARRTNWLGITGWAAAAVLTMLLIFSRKSEQHETTVSQPPVTSAVIPPKSSPAPLPESSVAAEEEGMAAQNDAGPLEEAEPSLPLARHHDEKVIVRVETKRLIQEIEVLREKLESFQERDRERFEPVPGMSWPIVMRMTPPKSELRTTVEKTDPPITAMIGDALTDVTTALAGSGSSKSDEMPAPPAGPSAIPIYDVARDTGTLVVNNLPVAAPDESYNLWVDTKSGGKAIYVGRLPNLNSQTAESFDFSLGSKATIPASFILTRDPHGKAVQPSPGNTVLRGPP